LCVGLVIAKEKVQLLESAVINLIQLRASVELVCYSDLISSQVGHSLAAHAFGAMQHALFDQVLIRLCAVWDKSAIDRASLPAICSIVRNDEAIEALTEEMRAFHLRECGEESARRSASKVRTKIAEAVKLTEAMLQSDTLKAVQDYRDREIAHVLSLGAKRKSPDRISKFGDEDFVFSESLKVSKLLLFAISKSQIFWEVHEEQQRRYARAFWNSVTLKALE